MRGKILNASKHAEVNMVIWVLSLLICLLGLVVYAISNNGKAQALALHCFWVGLLAFLLTWGGHFTMAVH